MGKTSEKEMVSLVQQKKDEQNGNINSEEQNLENSAGDERLPEFDEFGTALNDI
ncbi:hypothetical protein IEC97_00140 [Neobacillus cucumis]|uniref:hypothetical protein n=1 Tax=Neobacillus cucumis TaxID=1740721 RepID=UPI0018DF7AC2|nr:hypothetical protein [Neobacillus cucumis]MBI0575751.1 hypothetical protein [Neobacillus cucumis]WHY89934.1 hypothetical protein QNK12_19940 [Neobacillus cucumis]